MLPLRQESPWRVPAPCPLYDRCGGCHLQHLRYIDQLAHKYLGLDKNPYAKAGDVRVMFEISVFSVQGMS